MLCNFADTRRWPRRAARASSWRSISHCVIFSRRSGAYRRSLAKAKPCRISTLTARWSLPLAFDTTLETIPSDVPYLSFPGNAGDWHAWLGERKGPRIGLVWSGNPTHPNDHNRSIALETLLPLLDVEAQFISLQKDLRPVDAAVLRERSDIRDAGPELKNFTDTATLLGHLDLLITVDTSVAHLAGALGRPAWVLLPRLPDWRWMLDREDNPWYPSLRLFRQTETATWPPVVQRVKEALQEFVAGGEPSIVRALV